jgi:uncharacterized membrane protein
MRKSDVEARIEKYLSDFRRALIKVPAAEREDILQEIRCHIVERVEAYGEVTELLVNQILDSVGDPKQLASQYKTSAMLRRAVKSRSPWVLLSTTFRWATTGVAGVVALITAVIGYGAATASSLCFLLKPFFPSRVGLWLSPQHTLTLGYWNGKLIDTEIYGFAFRPPFNFVVLGTLPSTKGPVRETLGLWIYPVCFLGALLLLVATTSFTRWFIRKFGPRKSLSLNAGDKTECLQSTAPSLR